MVVENYEGKQFAPSAKAFSLARTSNEAYNNVQEAEAKLAAARQRYDEQKAIVGTVLEEEFQNYRRQNLAVLEAGFSAVGEFWQVLAMQDVICREPGKLDPPEEDERITVVVSERGQGVDEATMIWCARAREGNGNCGVNGPPCIFGSANTDQARVTVTGDAMEPVLTGDTAIGLLELDTKSKYVRVEGGGRERITNSQVRVVRRLLQNPGRAMKFGKLHSSRRFAIATVGRLRSIVRSAGADPNELISTVENESYRLNVHKPPPK